MGTYFLYKQLLSWCPDLLLIGLLFLKKPSNWQHRRQLKLRFTFSKSRNNDFIWTNPRATILQYNTVVSFYTKTLTINITLHINQDLCFSVLANPATLQISSMCSQFRWHAHNSDDERVWLELRKSRCLSIFIIQTQIFNGSLRFSLRVLS